jgi:transposase
MMTARLQDEERCMPTIPPLLVSDAERVELERRVRAHTTPQRAVKRARVVLLAADGIPNRQIAPLVAMDPHTVAQWRRRFAVERLAGLEDRQRSGRPLVYGHDDRLRIVAQVTQEPPDPASHWSHRQLAGALADIGISASQIGRILADLDIKPHRVRGWITRPDDPTFWERAADVCGLYLVPPTNALVLSVDEKTGIGARSRTRPATRPAPGRPSRQEHEYVRHGTATLLAALDVHRGGVVQAADVDRNTAANFIAFLDDLDACVPADLQVHLVLDNGASHIANATRWWFVDHSRFHAHYTPTHALWLNQVELFFSILARRLLKRGEFASVEDLVAKVMAFIADYNRTAKPFRWTYDGRPLKAN